MVNEADKELLTNFLYENRDLEKIEDMVEEFNIFNALNIRNEEVKHSIFLSWMLTPSQNHGMGEYFLKSFISRTLANAFVSTQIPSIIEVDSWNLSDAEVLREWNCIDISIY